MAADHTPPFDWCSFFALFSNDRGIKCKIHVPETVLFRYGDIAAWWSTNKEGYIQKRALQNASVDAVQKRFLQVLKESQDNNLWNTSPAVPNVIGCKYAAICRTGDGRCQLLSEESLTDMCNKLKESLAGGGPPTSQSSLIVPDVLQSFVNPQQDLRYITTYINKGTHLTCHTFQRRFTGRCGDALGPVDPAVKMQLRKLTHHIVKYIQRAHDLVLRGLVCEYIRDSSGRPLLLAVLQTDWVSNASGKGAGGYEAANLIEEPHEEGEGEEVWTDDDDLDPGLASTAQGQGSAPKPTVSGPTPMSGLALEVQSPTGTLSPMVGSPGRPASAGNPLSRPKGGPSELPNLTGGPQNGRRSSLASLPGSIPNGRHLQLTNSWPSAAHQHIISSPETSGHHSEVAVQGNGQGGSVKGLTSLPPESRPRTASPSIAFGRSSPGPRAPSTSLSMSPPKSLTTMVPQSPSAYSEGYSPIMMGRPWSPAGPQPHSASRSSPLIAHHLAKELEGTRDQLIYQHDLAEASAAKVRQLEKEKEVIVDMFEQKVALLEAQLTSTINELANTKIQRDLHQKRADAAEDKVKKLDEELSRTNQMLSNERGTAMTAIREYQQRDAAMRHRVEQLESETRAQSERLREESVASTALKRQLMVCQDQIERGGPGMMDQDGALDPSMMETLEYVRELLDSQLNPSGERYSLQKVLQNYHTMLRSVFLYYCQLENSFAQHWPPHMTYSQWMSFCQQSEATDPRAGARIRSSVNNMMVPPGECERLYRMYSKPDYHSYLDNQPVLSYEGFLAALVHLGELLKRPEALYLSETCRDFILKYVAKAQKVAPPVGMRKGHFKKSNESVPVRVRKSMGGLVSPTASVSPGSIEGPCTSSGGGRPASNEANTLRRGSSLTHESRPTSRPTSGRRASTAGPTRKSSFTPEALESQFETVLREGEDKVLAHCNRVGGGFEIP